MRTRLVLGSWFLVLCLEVIVVQLEEQAFQQSIQQIEALTQRIESIADPATRESAGELVQAVLDLHGAALERMIELVAEAGAPGEAIVESFARDDLVGSLLLLHG